MTVCTSPTSKETMVTWSKVAFHGAEFLAEEVEERIFPPVGVLRKAYEASDKSWIDRWVAQDGEGDAACDHE